MAHLRCLLALAALSGCSGTTTTNGGGPGPAGHVMLPDGGNVPTVSCGDPNVASITGTWDIIGSRPGDGQSTAVLTIDGSNFSFSASGKSLTFTTSGAAETLVWTDPDRGNQVPIAVTYSPSPVDTGLLTLAVGGAWTFSSTTDGEMCTASLGANGFNASCNGVSDTPFGRLEGTVVAQRQQTFASVLGLLGGAWHLAGNGGGSVDATISGNTFTAVVNGQPGVVGHDGWVTASVCNGMATGQTSDGFEFAATRQ